MSGNVEDIYPLAPLQNGLLFHSVYAAEDTDAPYVAQHIDQLTGPLDASLLEKAWQHVVDRHGALRAGFVWEDVSEPVQVVLGSVAASFVRLDWTYCAPAAVDSLLTRYAERDRRRGFDLGRPPLHRLTLIQLDDQTHYLVVTFHHLLLDGWSVAAITAEFFAAYRSLLKGRSPQPAPVGSYRDYVAWLAGRSQSAARRHWSAYLQGFGGCSLSDRPVAAAEPSTGPPAEPIAAAVLTERETEAVLAFCRRQRITVNTVVQAALGLILARLTGRDDVAFGGIVSTRPAEVRDVESIVGMLINTLPVRVRIDRDRPVSQWLRHLQQEQIHCRQFDYAALSDVQGWSDLPAGGRLFDALLAFQNFPSVAEDDADPELPVVRRHASAERSGYPLSVTADVDQRLQAFFTFDPRRFGSAARQRTAELFRELVRAMVADPAALVGALPTMTTVERDTIVHDWSGVAATPTPATAQPVHALIEAQTDRTPEATALVFADQRITYRQLDRDANRLAHQLRADGARRSAIVAVCVDRAPTLIHGLLAALKCGAAYMLLDPTHPDQRLRAVLAAARPAALLTTSTHATRFADCPALTETTLIRLDDPSTARRIADRPAHRPSVPVGPEDRACVMFTSGSSGRPKAVVAPHRALTATHTGGSYLEHGPQQSYLQCSPVPWDAFALEVFSALFHGGSSVLQPGQTPDPIQLESLVPKHSVRALQLASSLFNVLVDEQSAALRTVHTVMVGAEAASPRHAAAFLRTRPTATLVNGYGPVESMGFTTTHNITLADTAGPIPIGRPVQGKQVYVLDRWLQPVPVGVIGELYAAGAGLAHGYLGQPGGTAERFVACAFGDPGARMYRTGDLARWREDGTLAFHGRADDQVKIRGFRVEPREVEAVLAEAPGVDRAVVLGRPAGPERYRLVAYVATTAAAGAAETSPPEAELRAYLRRRLPDYMMPAAFVAVPEFPLNGNGKVDRRALPEVDGPSEPAPAARYVPPATPTERQVAAVWAEVLGRDRIGVGDNFFALGGDSLASIRLVSRLRKLGLMVTPRMVLEHPTIAELAAQPDVTRTASAGRPMVTSAPADDLQVGLIGLNASTAATRIFCLPYGGGGLVEYQRLAARLTGTARVFGLQDNATDYVRAGRRVSIVELAARFVRAIRAEQPIGPYHLLGWSLGGVLAYETARQLRCCGADVGPVGVIDSVVPVPSWRPEAESDLASGSRALAALVDSAPDAAPTDALVRELAALRIDRDQLDLGRAHLEQVLRRSIMESGWLLDYHPARSDQDLILFQASESTWPAGYADQWRSLARSVDRHVIAGHHHAPLLEPGVATLAQGITAALRHRVPARD